MFLLDLKRADVAIRSGRLDEAFDLLQATSEREHRDGQRLVDRLADAFMKRLTEHLTAGRIEDARQDGNKLLHLAGRTSEITELLQQISAAEKRKRDQQQLRDDLLASAEQQVRVGEYSIGARLLDRLNNGQSESNAAAVHRVGQSIEAKRTIVERTAVRLQAAIDAQSFEAAVGMIVSLQPDQRNHSRITALIPDAVTPLVRTGLSEFVSGRLDRAAAIDDLLRPLQQADPGIPELQQCLKRCRQVQAALAAGQYSVAEAQLNVLSQIVENAVWVTQARTALADVQRNLNLVISGPLGLLSTPLTDPAESDNASRCEVPLGETQPQLQPERQHSNRHILQVDGLGGLLLLRNSVVTVGPAAASSTRFDVPLFTEGSSGPIHIRRDINDDYFAESEAPFAVNGQPQTRRLLVSGDTLSVGNRGRLKFLKPVAASGSAVLQITSSRLACRDIRSVVLMSDSLLFGPAGSHFRLPSVSIPIVLHCDGDNYALRQMNSGQSQSSPLRPGQCVDMDDVRFTLV